MATTKPTRSATTLITAATRTATMAITTTAAATTTTTAAATTIAPRTTTNHFKACSKSGGKCQQRTFYRLLFRSINSTRKPLKDRFRKSSFDRPPAS